MKRSVLIVALTITGALSLASSTTLSGYQAGRDNSTKVKQVKVNAQVLAKLKPEENYVVDLTRDGSIYEFDPTTGPIDFKRVAVRNAEGQEAIECRLGNALSKEELALWYSQGFRIGRVLDFRNDAGVRPLARIPCAEIGFSCDRNYCTCSGFDDCWAMYHASACDGDFIACTERGSGKRCICSRTRVS